MSDIIVTNSCRDNQCFDGTIQKLYIPHCIYGVFHRHPYVRGSAGPDKATGNKWLKEVRKKMPDGEDEQYWIDQADYDD